MSFNRSAIGILMTLLTIMFGVITGLCVRSVGDAAPLITVLMYRFVCSIPLLLLLALAVRGRQFLQVNARRTLMVRIAFGCAAMTLWFTSLRLLPLGQATALFQSSVIFVTIFSPLMLGERIGIYRWSAVVTGMIGIVLLTNPFDGGFSFNVVFGIGGAMAGAALSILLRRLGKADNPFSIALWYNGTGGILLTMLALTVGVPMVVPDQTVMATSRPAWRGRIGAAVVHHHRLQVFRGRRRRIASLYADPAGSACRLSGAWRDCHPFRSGGWHRRDRQLPVHCLA